MSDQVTAPWDERTVKVLNEYQEKSWMHPFTCGHDHGAEAILVATEDGWICSVEGCTYTQNWAHTFMTETPVRTQPDLAGG